MLVAKRSTRVPFLLLACLMLTGCVDVPLGDDVKLGERSTSSCSKEGRSLLALLHEEIQRGLAEQKNLQLEDAFNCDDSGRDGISVTFDSSDLSTFIAVFEQSWDCENQEIKDYIGTSYVGKTDVLQCAASSIVFNLEFEDEAVGPSSAYAFPDSVPPH